MWGHLKLLIGLLVRTPTFGNDLIEYSTPIGEKINLIGGQLNSNEPLKDKHHYFFLKEKKSLSMLKMNGS